MLDKLASSLANIMYFLSTEVLSLMQLSRISLFPVNYNSCGVFFGILCMSDLQITFRSIQHFPLTRLQEGSNQHLDKTEQDGSNSIVAQIVSFSIQLSICSLVLVTASVGDKAVVNWEMTTNQTLLLKAEFFYSQVSGFCYFSAELTSLQNKLEKKSKTPDTEKDKSFQFFTVVFQSCSKHRQNTGSKLHLEASSFGEQKRANTLKATE